MKIREAGWEDYAQIAAMLARCGLSPKTREEWEHLWINNPVYKTLTNWPIGWVAENPDQEIVGYVGNIPLSFELRGREILASSFFSLSVDFRYRGYAGFLIRRAFTYKTPELLVGTTVNPAASKILAARQSNTPVTAWGDGSAHRDFLYIKDAARALHTIMNHVSGSVNLASGTTRKIRDVVAILAAYSGVNQRIVWDASKPRGYIFRAFDVSRLQAAGFTCHYTLEQALPETYDWYASHGGAVRS